MLIAMILASLTGTVNAQQKYLSTADRSPEAELKTIVQGIEQMDGLMCKRSNAKGKTPWRPNLCMTEACARKVVYFCFDNNGVEQKRVIGWITRNGGKSQLSKNKIVDVK